MRSKMIDTTWETLAKELLSLIQKQQLNSISRQRRQQQQQQIIVSSGASLNIITLDNNISSTIGKPFNDL